VKPFYQLYTAAFASKVIVLWINIPLFLQDFFSGSLKFRVHRDGVSLAIS
jgi:hypothetical protein